MADPKYAMRLPSFRAPRDLKLTEFRELPPNPLNEGRTKRVFVPNLNVQRKKTEGKDAQPSGETNKPNNWERGKREERGRTRGKKNFIQGSGVFSEGLAPTLKSAGWRSKTSTNEPTTSIPKPKMKLAENVSINKEEEELVMKELMRDDFLEEPDLEPDLNFSPIQLPLQNLNNFFCIDEKPKIEKQEVINGIRVKQEPGVVNCEMNGVVEDKPHNILARSTDKNFMFLQIPSCVPQLKMNISHQKMQKRTSQQPCEENEEAQKCILRTLPQGRIGTMQILKSGRARLILGDVKLSIEPGTPAAFKQDLISINLDEATKSGNMVNLGGITTRMLVTPHWESLFKKKD